MGAGWVVRGAGGGVAVSARQLALDAGVGRLALPWVRTEFVCREGAAERPILSSPGDFARWAFLAGLDRSGDGREWFHAVALDVRHRLIGEAYPVSVGCLSASLVHPREVFRFALTVSAARLIVCHNHPSGDPEPSGEDLALTRRLAAAGTLLGVEILDHVILGAAGRWVSLKERGVL